MGYGVKLPNFKSWLAWCWCLTNPKHLIKYAGVFANSSSQLEARACCPADKKQADRGKTRRQPCPAKWRFALSPGNIKIFYTEGGKSVNLKACREARDPRPPIHVNKKPNPSRDLKSIKIRTVTKYKCILVGLCMDLVLAGLSNRLSDFRDLQYWILLPCSSSALHVRSSCLDLWAREDRPLAQAGPDPQPPPVPGRDVLGPAADCYLQQAYIYPEIVISVFMCLGFPSDLNCRPLQ